MRGQRLQNVGRGEWNMQKEPDLVLAAPGPQFATQRHEVVIVNPNDVVFAHERAQLVGKQPVHTQIPCRVGARIFLQIDAVVQNWPQHAIGQTVVILLKILGRKIHQRIRDLIHLDRSHFGIRLIVSLAAPAEPETISVLQDGLYRDRQAARHRRARRFRNGDPIGDNYDAGAHASLQCDESRVAALIMPAMEQVLALLPMNVRSRSRQVIRPLRTPRRPQASRAPLGALRRSRSPPIAVDRRSMRGRRRR